MFCKSFYGMVEDRGIRTPDLLNEFKRSPNWANPPFIIVSTWYVFIYKNNTYLEIFFYIFLKDNCHKAFLYFRLMTLKL